jgi:hypothetical protein
MVVGTFLEKAFLIQLFLWKLQSVTTTSIHMALKGTNLKEGLFAVLVKDFHEL